MRLVYSKLAIGYIVVLGLILSARYSPLIPLVEPTSDKADHVSEAQHHDAKPAQHDDKSCAPKDGCYSGDVKLPNGEPMKANCNKTCRTCDIDPQTGVGIPKENTSCTRYCKKFCCHCETRCST